MKEVGFYEISRGEPPVRMGTGTLAQVRRMEHPACYLCLHGVLGTDQPMLWANMGVAVFDEVSGRFKDKKQKGLGRHGAPLSFVLRATPQIYGALAVVRAFRREVPYVRDAARSVARSPTESIDVRGEEESLEEGASGGSWPVILAAFSVSTLFLL